MPMDQIARPRLSALTLARLGLWCVLVGIIWWTARTAPPYQDGWWNTAPECLGNQTCTREQLAHMRRVLWLAAGAGWLVALGIAVLGVLSLPARRQTRPTSPWMLLSLVFCVVVSVALTGAGWMATGLVFGGQVAVLWLAVACLLGATLLHWSTREVERPRRHQAVLLLSLPGMIGVFFVLQVILGSQNLPFAVTLVLLALLWAGVAATSFLMNGGRWASRSNGPSLGSSGAL